MPGNKSTTALTTYMPVKIKRLIDIYRAHGHDVNFSAAAQKGVMERLLEIEDARKASERPPISSRASLVEILQEIEDRIYGRKRK